MTLKELKTSIEDGTYTPSMTVFVGERFIPNQYISYIKKYYKYNLITVDTLEELATMQSDGFFEDVDSSTNDIYVCKVTNVDLCHNFDDKNVIIVTDKISDEAKKFYANNLIFVPKLESWQIKDMVYSMCQGADSKYLDYLLSVCGTNIDRLYNECQKVSIFNNADKSSILDEMIADCAFDDISNSTIFALTTSIIKKDVKELTRLYSELENMDVSEFGLLTILIQNFMNVFHIQTGINPTADKLGLKQNQFNAIKYNCGKYTGAELVNILNTLTSIDKRVKNGEFPVSMMLDYILVTTVGC